MDLREKILAREINRLLWNSGKTVSLAESCSGGRLAAVFTEMPGSSNYFKGGIVCYTDEMKERYLHVPKDLLEQRTAVCEEVAVDMVKGALKMFDSDYAISMTGLAGPTGGTLNIPVGTIWGAYGSENNIVTYHFYNDCGRDLNVRNAVCKLCSLFIDFIKAEKEE